uniref:Uncharacterized protein n=1 Tax=Spermophilus dauricus TaxID=99837 RepID=A0A8C9UK54_SPEDA
MMGMLMGPLCVAVAVFLLLVDLMHRRQCWASRYPPGPLPLLRLGNLLQIDFQNMPYPRYKVLNVVPVLLRIPGLPGRVFPAQKAFMAMVDELLEEHRMTWDPAQPPRDLPDAFLVEVEKVRWGCLRQVGPVHHPLTQHQAWVIWWLPLSLHQITLCLVQAKGNPGSKDARIFWGQGLLPRVQYGPTRVCPARFSGGVLISSFPVPAHGRHLLQGTMLITNLSSVLKDETVWEKPLRFHPGCPGPLCEAGGLHPESPLTGRRVCLGEPLARMELFLFFTCLLQRFSFSVPPGQARPSDRGVFAFIVAPSPDQLCAVLY